MNVRHRDSLLSVWKRHASTGFTASYARAKKQVRREVPLHEKPRLTVVNRGVIQFNELLLVERAVVGAGAIVGALLVHSEGVPCGGTEDAFVLHVVHAYGYAQH